VARKYGAQRGRVSARKNFTLFAGLRWLHQRWCNLVQIISKMRVSARKCFIDATLPCELDRTCHVVGHPVDPA
jgi:hypothetical protein